MAVAAVPVGRVPGQWGWAVSVYLPASQTVLWYIENYRKYIVLVAQQTTETRG